MIGIYKITNPKGKIYIGQSSNIYNRQKAYSRKECKNQVKLYYSILKYGFSEHIFEIIEQCTIEELNTRERYWQEYYNVLGDKGLNCKLTQAHDKLGKWSDEVKVKIGYSNSKAIAQYSKEGVIVKEWESIKKAAKFLNISPQHISCCLIGRQKSTKGFIWKYKTDNTDQIIITESVNNEKSIRQYSKEGIFIREWSSIVEAARNVGTSPGNIPLCLTNRQKSAKGFLWRYV
jgi:hypothetical protein